MRKGCDESGEGDQDHERGEDPAFLPALRSHGKSSSDNMAIVHLIPAALVVLVLCLLPEPRTCHRMEAMYENLLDVGPMERPGYFEEAYNGKDRGYGKVGHPYRRQLPVPKLTIHRTYLKTQPDEPEPEMRAMFAYEPGNLPLNLIPNIAQYMASMGGRMNQGFGMNGGLQFTRQGKPSYGMNFNYGQQYGAEAAGQGSIKGEVDNSGVQMSPDRANGW